MTASCGLLGITLAAIMVLYVRIGGEERKASRSPAPLTTHGLDGGGGGASLANFLPIPRQILDNMLLDSLLVPTCM